MEGTPVNLLPLLLAKAGAASLTTKVLVAGAVSAVAIGTAGATGVVPVDALLTGSSSSVTEDGSAEPTEMEAAEPTDGPDDSLTDDQAGDDDGTADQGSGDR